MEEEEEDMTTTEREIMTVIVLEVVMGITAAATQMAVEEVEDAQATITVMEKTEATMEAEGVVLLIMEMGVIIMDALVIEEVAVEDLVDLQDEDVPCPHPKVMEAEIMGMEMEMGTTPMAMGLSDAHPRINRNSPQVCDNFFIPSKFCMRNLHPHFC